MRIMESIKYDNIKDNSVKAYIPNFLTLYDNFNEHHLLDDGINDIYTNSDPYVTLAGVIRGSISLRVNGNIYNLVSGDVFSFVGITDLDNVKVSDDLLYFIIEFTEDVINSSKKSLGINHLIFNWEKQGFVYTHVDKAQMEYGIFLYNFLYKWTKNNLHIYHKNIVQHLANIFIIKSIELSNLNNNLIKLDKKNVVSRQNVVFQNFIELIEQYSDRYREVKFYAAKLNVTPKYLSAVSRIYTDKSASDTIEQYVVDKIKTLLLENEYSIKEICNMMNFNSQSFFGRYFKRTTGISPRAFVKMNS